MEDIGYETSILLPRILYVPGIEDKDDIAILQEVLESYLLALVVVNQKTLKFKKIYILLGSNKKFEYEKYIKELGFLVFDNTKEIDDSSHTHLKFECIASNDIKTHELQSIAIESAGFVKFIITGKLDENNTYTSIKQKENQDIEKNTKFFVKAMSNKDVVDKDNSYTITLADKELAKCSMEKN